MSTRQIYCRGMCKISSDIVARIGITVERIFNQIWIVMETALLSSAVTIDTNHDDVIKWKHFPRNWPFVRGIHRSPVNSPHKDQWRRAFMFSLICAWTNAWVNNREAGDLRRHRAHYDVIVVIFGAVKQRIDWILKGVLVYKFLTLLFSCLLGWLNVLFNNSNNNRVSLCF